MGRQTPGASCANSRPAVAQWVAILGLPCPVAVHAPLGNGHPNPRAQPRPADSQTRTPAQSQPFSANRYHGSPAPYGHRLGGASGWQLALARLGMGTHQIPPQRRAALLMQWAHQVNRRATLLRLPELDQHRCKSLRQVVRHTAVHTQHALPEGRPPGRRFLAIALRLQRPLFGLTGNMPWRAPLRHSRPCSQ